MEVPNWIKEPFRKTGGYTASDVPRQEDPRSPEDVAKDIRAKISDLNEQLFVASQKGIRVKIDIHDGTGMSSLSHRKILIAYLSISI